MSECRTQICIPGDAAAANWAEAGALYQEIVAEKPHCANAWYGLGRVQAARGDHAGALQSYAKACDLFPPYGAAHYALAAELRRVGKGSDAAHHSAAYLANVTAEPPVDDPLLQRVHSLNEGTQYHLQRGAELAKAGNLQEAIREQQATLAIDPNNVQANVNLISLYGRTGEHAKARQHFEAAVKLNLGHSDAWYNYGVLLVDEGNFAEAKRAFRRALEINPHYAEAHNSLGSICEREGQLDDAANEFREAIAEQPDYSLARFHLGRLLVNQGRYDEAVQQFRKTLQRPEDSRIAVYLYALAATFARAGDREQALHYFQQAREAAAAHDQIQLLGSIERDLKTFDSQR